MNVARLPAAEVVAALGGPVQYLGSGSFAQTWRFGDQAVKIITAEGYPAERLAREVDGLNRVDSQHVVTLHDVRTISVGGRRRTALFFDYVGGGDLQGRLDAGGWPSPDEALEMLGGLLRGVRDLHATGTVHRDIKPANIGFRNTGWDRPVLLDLGLARGLAEATITVYPGLVGTANFMAPEQLAGRRARKAVDLFAVGVTTRLVLGQSHPFYPGAAPLSPAAAIQAITAGPTPLPLGIPDAITSLLDRMVHPAEHERGSAISSLARYTAARKATE